MIARRDPSQTTGEEEGFNIWVDDEDVADPYRDR